MFLTFAAEWLTVPIHGIKRYIQIYFIGIICFFLILDVCAHSALSAPKTFLQVW